MLHVCGVAHGALLTDFANSYAQYQSQTDAASDFDRDHDVDGLDYLTWQGGMGRTNETNNGHGDANADQFVNGLDLTMWNGQFATATWGRSRLGVLQTVF